MKLQVFAIWFAVTLQWGAVWFQWRTGRQQRRLHAELADTWAVLVEFAKVMQRYDDDECVRRAGDKVDALLRKYPPIRDNKEQPQ